MKFGPGFIDGHAFSSAVIVRAREAWQKDVFKRSVVSTVPFNFFENTVTFSCGHSHNVVFSIATAEDAHCDACRVEWMVQEQAKEGVAHA